MIIPVPTHKSFEIPKQYYSHFRQWIEDSYLGIQPATFYYSVYVNNKFFNNFDTLDLDVMVVLNWRDNNNIILISFKSFEIYDHAKKAWTENFNKFPLTSSKFDNDFSLILNFDLMWQLKQEFKHSNNIIYNQYMIANGIKEDLTNSLGPEYENWHMYYDYNQNPYGRVISFKTEEYKAVLKFKYGI